jgi:phosphatidylinositol alpha-mannosyltransferase
MVCPYDMAVPGGVQSQVDGLSRALGALGAELTVIAPSTSGRAPAGAGYTFCGVGRSISVAANGSRAPVAPGPLAMARTLQALRAARPDVVHLHEPLTPGCCLAALLAGPRPIVATFHRAGTDAVYNLEGKVLRGLLRRLDSTVAVSEAARATASQVLGRALAAMPIIPNGVSIEAVDPPERPAGGEFVLVFVGRHEERKGLAVLLRALRQLPPGDGRRLRLRIVGDGPQNQSLRLEHADSPSIEWLGAVDDAARLDALKGADLFVAPSTGGESFGVVLLEAMAAGAPVLASDLPGYRLAAGDAAAYFKAGDAADLAAAIAALVAEPVALRALAAAARDHVRQFSLDAIAAKYMELYGRLAARALA